MDKKTLLAIILCLLFYVGYTKYLTHKYPDMNKPQVTETAGADKADPSAAGPGTASHSAAGPGTANQGAAGPGSAANANSAASPAGANGSVDQAAPVSPLVSYLAPEDLILENDKVKITFDQMIGGISSVLLKNYKESAEPGSETKKLIEFPLAIQGTIDVAQTAPYKNIEARRSGDSLVFSRVQDDVEITQAFQLGADYELEVATSFKNTRAVSRSLTAGVLLHQNFNMAEEDDGSFFMSASSFIRRSQRFVHGLAGEHDGETIADYCADPEGKPVIALKNADIQYIGADYHYFGAFWLPKDKKLNADYQKVGGTPALCTMALTVYSAYGLVPAGGTVQANGSLYLGPKSVDQLKALGREAIETVDFGWFGFLGKPLLTALMFLNELFQNYGISIIVLTIILKIAFYPLTKSSVVSMKKMQKLQPDLTAIRERNKDNPQKQQQEMMAFMSKHKINPAQGCLPMLPQIPVFIAYYNVLSQSFALRHAPFYGWIHDLSAMDPYYILPVVLGVCMFVQQKLTPNPAVDKTQQRIMMLMPLFFSFMMLSLPSGMVLYMLTNTIVSIAQQQWLHHKIDQAA